MLYWLAAWLTQYYHGFQVFHYLSLRAILACLTSLFLSVWLGPKIIRFLQRLQVGQVIREEGPKDHMKKAGTPTMGGVLILLSIMVSCLLWFDLVNRDMWILLAVTLGFGLIGWVDDYLKVVRKHNDGLIPRWKFLWQSLFALAVGIFLYMTASSPAQTQLLIPIFKHVDIVLGPVLFLLIAYFIIVGFSNAVNLTDGLDGLAILPVVLVGGAMGVFAYVTGNLNAAHYLYIPYIPGVGELVIFSAALVGAGLGFLWFNAYPAEVFMGDVGSLGLGGALGVMAVMIRQEIILCLMGGIFVLEAVSVILQVGSYKTRKKRIFRMAPIHHHFELKGWSEPRIIVRFWIITMVLVLIGLATLKIR